MSMLLSIFFQKLGFLKDCVVFTKIYVRGVDHDHHPLQEEKLVAGAGAEGCVEGLKGWSGREGIWRTSISSSTNCWLTWPKPLSVMNLDVSSKAAWQLTTRMTKPPVKNPSASWQAIGPPQKSSKCPFVFGEGGAGSENLI